MKLVYVYSEPYEGYGSIKSILKCIFTLDEFFDEFNRDL
jgi:hypothetical protein